MSRRNRAVIGLVSLALLATSLGFTSMVPSQAAWTDQVYVQQIFASGTWVTTTTTTEPPPPEPNGPIYPGDATTTVSVTWDPRAPLQNCATVVVGTTSDTPTDWRYYIDFTGTPWHGSQPQHATDWPNRIVDGPTDGVMLVGNVDQEKIEPGETRTFTHCVYNGNPPPVVTSGPDTYTYTGSALNPDTNLPWYACVEATVTGHYSAWGSPQFVGFSVPLDWAAALDQGVIDSLITAEQATSLLSKGLSYFQVGGDTTIAVRNGDVYTLTGTGWNNSGIKAGQELRAIGCT